jgi:hypothetical protein
LLTKQERKQKYQDYFLRGLADDSGFDPFDPVPVFSILDKMQGSE